MAVTDTLKDAAYVTIGLGVLGFQKAQVRRNELTKQIEAQLKQFETQVKQFETQVPEVRRTFNGIAAQLDGYVAPVRTQFDKQFDSFEASLPPQVQDLVKQARTAAHQTEETLRERLGFASA